MHIAYYISSHGFGHAARQQAIIAELAAHGVTVHVRSAAPAKFFQFPQVRHYSQAFDVGVIQADAMTMDIPATFASYTELMAQAPQLIRQEVAYLQAHHITLVVADMPPLAFEVARAARVASAAITHFTWDWVYTPYVDGLPERQLIVDHIRAQYSLADVCLALPFAHELDMFPHVEPIGLVINRPTMTREQVRANFHIPDDHKIALLSMGGLGWQGWNVSPIREMVGWTFLVMPEVYPTVQDVPHVRLIPKEYPAFHNLLAAADVKIGKAGWSTVAECIGHQTPMMYLLRDDWRENTLLDWALREYANGMQVSEDMLQTGDWLGYLDFLANPDFYWPEIPTDGAQQAALRLMELAQG